MSSSKRFVNYIFLPISYLAILFITLPSFASIQNDLLVDINWLKEKQSSENIIIDVRSYEEYTQGHIPHAVNIPVKNTFNPKNNTDRVANIRHIKSLFSDAGIDHEKSITLYDDGSHIDAGRVFWVFEVYGHKNVKLLSGGYPAWVKKHHQDISTEQVIPIKTNYVPNLNPKRLSTKLSVQLAIHDEGKIIIDARSRAEFEGIESIASRAGHIPSAINIPWDENFTEIDGVVVLKDNSELRKIYEKIDPTKKVFLYCNKGKQSSLSYSVMRNLGFDAAHYDGSWFEWGNDKQLPIVH